MSNIEQVKRLVARHAMDRRGVYDHAMARKEPEAVGVEELKDALLRTIVEKFGGRPLTWEVAEQALSVAAFEIKQAALLMPGILVDTDQRSPKAKRSSTEPKDRHGHPKRI